jgi:hypothetical protein
MPAGLRCKADLPVHAAAAPAAPAAPKLAPVANRERPAAAPRPAL